METLILLIMSEPLNITGIRRSHEVLLAYLDNQNSFTPSVLACCFSDPIKVKSTIEVFSPSSLTLPVAGVIPHLRSTDWVPGNWPKVNMAPTCRTRIACSNAGRLLVVCRELSGDPYVGTEARRGCRNCTWLALWIKIPRLLAGLNVTTEQGKDSLQ